MEFGLHEFQHLVSNSTVAVFADNSTALAYLRKQGGTRSLLLNSIAQRILRWAESIDLILVPQFIQGKNNVLADSLSRPNQIQGSEWTLKWEVFQELNRKWPVMIDLFATLLNHRCSLYFLPFRDRFIEVGVGVKVIPYLDLLFLRWLTFTMVTSHQKALVISNHGLPVYAVSSFLL